MRRLLLLTGILLLAVYGVYATDTNPDKRNYRTKKFSGKAPVIDGLLTDDAWTQAVKSGNFTQFQPYEGRAPSQKTEFAILYDENNLYVAIWAYDNSPDSIIRRLTRRDEIDGDLVGVDFDSYYDHRTAFGFWVSAGGVKMDRIATNDGGTEDNTWDPIWYVETHIGDKGWTAEMRIPLSQLRFGEMVNQIWGMNVVRMIYRHNEISLWSPIPRDISGYVHMYGDLQGIEGIRPRKQVDVTPYTVASVERFEKVADNPFKTSGKDSHYSAGVDAKVGITNNFILDLTINPDFGQVEADPSQVNLTAFETFYEEKRPFFIEGRSILSMPLMMGDGDLANENLFYTRRIGRRPHGSSSLNTGEYSNHPDFTRILGAAKITGKTKNGWSVGLLESVTSEEKAEITSGENTRYETVEPMTNYLIGTIQKDFNQGNTLVSGMVTSTNRKLDQTGMETMLHRSAYTAGLNFTQFFKNKSYMLMLKTYFSRVNGSAEAITQTQMSPARYYQRPDIDYVTLDTTRTGLTGNGGTFFLGRIGNAKFQYGAFLTWKSPGVELNDVGYIQTADQILEILWAGYRFNEPFWIIRQAGLNTNHWTGHDFGGRFQGYGGNINGQAEFKNMWSASFNLNWQSPELDTRLLRGGPAFKSVASLMSGFSMSTDSRKKFIARANMFFKRAQFDHMNMNRFNMDFTYRPFNTLSLTLSPYLTQIDNNMQYMGKQDFGGEPRY
ncbi:MAG: carbohydrate binding family 9 domain-containing protein, partial [Bacteroidales bacterium]|nr:carbohydrate binding family 9 domain-containing protein [Bacteroidales bacterium]